MSPRRSLQSVDAVAVAGDELAERADQPRSCYTVADVCARLRVSERTFDRLFAAGDLPFVQELLPRLGRIRRFKAAPIDRYLAGEWNRRPFGVSHSPRKKIAS